MVKRGIAGCGRYCQSCKMDCTCEYCSYCHTCCYRNVTNYGTHTWSHTCTGPDPVQPTVTKATKVDSVDVSGFLRDTSDRFAQFCGSEVYAIKLSEDKTYFVHAEALRQTSPVMKKHIELEMKEKLTKTIELKDMVNNDIAFVFFMQFSYFGSYGYDEAKEDALQVHAMVYVFAEKFEVLRLKSLALKKATVLCSKAVNDKSATGLIKVLQFVLPETVATIYSGTYDPSTGKYPSSLNEKSGNDTIAIKSTVRDGFRMLLAKFAAHYIEKLRQNESFVTAIQEYPSFGVDVLLFTGTTSTFSTDGKGCLQF
ncbi:hypothetical protein TWF730_007512 [Orbilia blumenaviensis]|uniref:BTB domain-containing protein n=1 Tax=Orbilia blumenaviensis TaxID=1796055 RepID=A0AAV9VAD0_9PEZI